MTDTPNPAPAGAGDAPAPVNDKTLSPEERLAAWDPDPEQDAPETEEPAGSTDTEESTDEGELGSEPEGNDEGQPEEGAEEEEPGDDAPEAEPEAKPDDDDETGNRVHRLRDGTQATVADLKRGFDEARQFRAALPRIQQERHAYLQEKQQFVVQQQQLQPILANVAEMLSKQIPPMPDQALFQSDPIEFFQQKHQHETALGQLRQINEAKAQQEEQGRRQMAQNLQAAHQQAIEHYTELRPELRDPEKAKAYSDDLRAVAKHLGYSDQDLGRIYDPRPYELSRLAAIGLKAEQAQKQAAQVKTEKKVVVAKKVADKPPVVQTPAARQSAGTRNLSALRSARDRLKRTGATEDGIAALNALDF